MLAGKLALALAVLDEPMPGTEQGPVLEARVEGGVVVLDEPPSPSGRRRKT
jgi:hypothetical protein